jgi:hypothetical protein
LDISGWWPPFAIQAVFIWQIIYAFRLAEKIFQEVETMSRLIGCSMLAFLLTGCGGIRDAKAPQTIQRP